MLTSKLHSTSDWDELPVAEEIRDQLMELVRWLKDETGVSPPREAKRQSSGGHLALFHGPPGTGKKAAAALLGQKAGREVVRIDANSLVTRYIGETEKNLAKVLGKAQNEDWILFFDEADALFGKRTQVKDSHDRYTNSESNALLQRLGNYCGLIILSSKSRSNLDVEIRRHLHSLIRFRPRRAVVRLLARASLRPDLQRVHAQSCRCVSQKLPLCSSWPL